jgi:hypothetical protein
LTRTTRGREPPAGTRFFLVFPRLTVGMVPGTTLSERTLEPIRAVVRLTYRNGRSTGSIPGEPDMPRRKLLPLLAAILLTSSAFAGTRWLHVRVDDNGPDGDKVRVNIPLSVVEKMLPVLQNEDLKEGKVRIGDEEMDNADLRRMWQAVRSMEDSDFVTVQGTRQNLRVAKQGNFFVVQGTQGKGKKNNVNVRVPLRVVDALFSGDDPNELDILAAVKALGEHTDGDLVVVEDDDSSVRIWIDSAEQAE